VSFAAQVDAGYIASNYRQALDLFLSPAAAILNIAIWHRSPSSF
jgi:hypothetical protein